MKRTLLLICTLLCANVLMAQEQLATLKHNGNISVYYGVNAFVEAYNAASNGDTINLSDGNFNGTNISKRLVLRGNGAITDTARGSNGTLIAGNVTLHLQDSLHVEVEGINFQNNLELNNIAGSSKIKLSIPSKPLITVVNEPVEDLKAPKIVFGLYVICVDPPPDFIRTHTAVSVVITFFATAKSKARL